MSPNFTKPQRGATYQPRVKPWVPGPPQVLCSEGTPHIIRSYAAFLQNALFLFIPSPGRCPGLVCDALSGRNFVFPIPLYGMSFRGAIHDFHFPFPEEGRV